MKIINQEINMLTWFKPKGKIRPVKFQMTEGEEDVVVKVDRVLREDVDSTIDVRIHTFICQSIIKGVEKIYVLMYDARNLKWILESI